MTISYLFLTEFAPDLPLQVQEAWLPFPSLPALRKCWNPNASSCADADPEAFSTFLKDIDGARSSINIMVYIWTDGRMSDQIIEHLAAKLKEGVQVRILVDSFGSNWWERPRSKLNALIETGAKVEIFRSLTIAPWDFTKNHLRNHRRAFVIDGAIGYFGGTAISDPWLGDAGSRCQSIRSITAHTKQSSISLTPRT